MADQMESRGISLRGAAPIWAWVCGGDGTQPPTLDTARGLLSEGELIEGCVTVELDVPEQFTLVSAYSRYCDLFFEVLETKLKPTFDSHSDMFEITDEEWSDINGIQATLPCIRQEWIRDIRPLDLKPDDWSYDPLRSV